MEKEHKIKIPGTKKYIYGKQYGSLNRPMVVLVHGLTGFMDEHILYAAARYFDKKGFSSFRFNLYDWPKDARTLTQCTLETHANDLDVVINYLKTKGVKKIFAVGHSYGGPTILLSKKKDYDGVVLWDPSYDMGFLEAKYLKGTNAYRLDWGTEVLIGKRMIEYEKKISWDKLTPSINVPIKIIAAGKGILIKDTKKYYRQANEPKAFKIIPGAFHRFEEDGIPEKLYQETTNWLKKFA